MGLTVHFEVLNQLGTPMLYSSTLATRPAAGITGRIFYRTDSPFGIYRDNGTTWDLISSVGGGGLSGSGTATQVAYWDSTSSLTSNSGLYYDTTNTRLGIGTATPGAALDLHQTSGTIIQANATSLGNSQMAFQLQGTSKWQIGNVYQSGANYFRINDALSSVERVKVQNTGEFDIQGWEVLINTQTGLSGTSTIPFNNSFTNNFTYNSGLSTIASFNSIGFIVDNNYNFSGANTINSTSYNAALVLRSNMTFGTASASITYTQATGIRALSNKQSIYIQSGANSGTISHYANLQIFGDQKTGAGTTTFTNRYQILLNDYDEFTAGNTYTNRWAIYQDGASNNNYFGGKIITGSTTVGTTQLSVTGTSYFSNSVNIGSLTFLGNISLRVEKNITGNSTSFGIGQFGVIQSDVTSSARLIATSANTQSATFTLSNLYHFFAEQGTFGTNSIISNQYGFFANSTLIGGTNNYGFYGAIANGANRWNLYMAGTADNYMAGSLGIGSTSLTGYSIRNSKNITGSVISIGYYSDATIQSNVTTRAAYFSTYAQIQNTAFSLGTLSHYEALDGISGAATITNQYAFRANSSLIGAINNFGFVGEIPSGTGRWNLYMGGTAINFLNGGLTIGSTSLPASALLGMVSTTQGFLPPVMTKTQRNAISSPASGLIVINSTDSTLDGYDGAAATWFQSVRSVNGYVKIEATTSSTTGAASGQYLQINVNGTSYKLLLLNP